MALSRPSLCCQNTSPCPAVFFPGTPVLQKEQLCKQGSNAGGINWKGCGTGDARSVLLEGGSPLKRALARPSTSQDEASQTSLLRRCLLREETENPRQAATLGGLASPGLPLSDSAQGQRFGANVASVNAAINACKKEGQWQLALSLLILMLEMKGTPNKITYGAAISTCSRGGQWQQALSLLSSMPDMLASPDEITYNAAISACERASHWQLAMILLHGMPKMRVAPDRISYNTAISACSKGGQWQLALNVLSSLPESSALAPDEITYNAAISACERAGGQWQLALCLLKSMRAKRAAPNVISQNAAISACEKGGQWQLALSLLIGMPATRAIPDKISYSAAISACSTGGRWQLALMLLSSMQEMRATPNEISYGAAISACEKAHQWQIGLGLLSSMPNMRVRCNQVCYNAAMSACEKAGQWQLALTLLYRMLETQVTPNTISYSAVISACEKGCQWQLALLLLGCMPERKATPDEISYSAAISACGQGGQWQLALSLLRTILEQGVLPDEVCYTALISACEGSQQLEQGLQLLLEARQRGVSLSASFFPWALARLSVHDPDLITAAFDEAVLKLSASELSPQELSLLAWASGMLGVSNPMFFQVLVAQAIPQLKSFAMDDLLKLAWGCSAARGGVDLDLFRAIQEEVGMRLEDVDLQSFSESARAAFVQDTLGLLWACNFAGCLSLKLLVSARLVIRQAGAIMDRAHGLSSSQAHHHNNNVNNDNDDDSNNNNHNNNHQITAQALANDEVYFSRQQPASSEPRVVLELPDRLVIFKPPGWEVYDQGTDILQLSSFLQASLGFQHFPITQDPGHQLGFLHRLDVPSSGLVLAAKTYEAYYDLKVQLNAGEISRDYVILCHGWIRPSLKDIRASVSWRGLEPTSAGEQGKPSLTRLKVTAHAWHETVALSLVAVQIGTGRRHQIRSHFSHVGHPTVCDGKYTAEATFQSDRAFCARNFLHRCRLAFKDSAGKSHEVTMSAPADLVSSLQHITSRDSMSTDTIGDWLTGTSPRNWQEYTPLISAEKWHVPLLSFAYHSQPLTPFQCLSSTAAKHNHTP
ncbi:unnamed protein product [Polarella glacialis]|uniref:Pseudouridine synthase RsuA/RluA-like domain-containing protein n=1 Tax=Polarella glacialis TaxID=89957 RepID=A0A813J5K4_POLGL|nr:unnamed protein product [Polarella glacialis]